MISSSLSGLHIGLRKANSLHPVMNQIDTHFCDVCHNHSLHLLCWLKGLDVELYKEEGNCNVEHLQTIVLVEADFNINCKMLSCQIL